MKNLKTVLSIILMLTFGMSLASEDSYYEEFSQPYFNQWTNDTKCQVLKYLESFISSVTNEPAEEAILQYQNRTKSEDKLIDMQAKTLLVIKLKHALRSCLIDFESDNPKTDKSVDQLGNQIIKSIDNYYAINNYLLTNASKSVQSSLIPFNSANDAAITLIFQTQFTHEDFKNVFKIVFEQALKDSSSNSNNALVAANLLDVFSFNMIKYNEGKASLIIPKLDDAPSELEMQQLSTLLMQNGYETIYYANINQNAKETIKQFNYKLSKK